MQYSINDIQLIIDNLEPWTSIKSLSFDNYHRQYKKQSFVNLIQTNSNQYIVCFQIHALNILFMSTSKNDSLVFNYSLMEGKKQVDDFLENLDAYILFM